MCHAMPAQIRFIDPDTDTAIVTLDDIEKDVSVALLDDLEPGDFVLIHVGFALNKISPDEAERTLAIMSELDKAQQSNEKGAL